LLNEPTIESASEGQTKRRRGVRRAAEVGSRDLSEVIRARQSRAVLTFKPHFRLKGTARRCTARRRSRRSGTPGESDPRVAAFWRRALTDPSFAEQVEAFECTRERVEAVISDTSTENLAFWTLIKNRCSFGGNLDGGLMRDVASRWNGRKLSATLRLIYSMSGRITFLEDDGVKVLEAYSHREDAMAFADPPYTTEITSAGHKLYQYSKLDHGALFRVLGGWSGPWIATYDDNDAIRKIVRGHGLVARAVKMRTNHHKEKYELVIGPDLSWLAQEDGVSLDQIERGGRRTEIPTKEEWTSTPYRGGRVPRNAASEWPGLTSPAKTAPCAASDIPGSELRADVAKVMDDAWQTIDLASVPRKPSALSTTPASMDTRAGPALVFPYMQVTLEHTRLRPLLVDRRSAAFPLGMWKVVTRPLEELDESK
jgi:DNA adenine methylase